MQGRLLIGCWLLLLATGCTQPDNVTLPYEPVGDLKHTMSIVLEPAADVIWDSAGTIETLDSVQDLRPTTEEGWNRVKHAASVVAETGNLLMMPGRAKDNGDWVEISGGLILTGKAALDAAENKDADALFEAGGQIYNVCVSCHQIYWVEGQANRQ